MVRVERNLIKLLPTAVIALCTKMHKCVKIEWQKTAALMSIVSMLRRFMPFYGSFLHDS